MVITFAYLRGETVYGYLSDWAVAWLPLLLLDWAPGQTVGIILALGISINMWWNFTRIRRFGLLPFVFSWLVTRRLATDDAWVVQTNRIADDYLRAAYGMPGKSGLLMSVKQALLMASTVLMLVALYQIGVNVLTAAPTFAAPTKNGHSLESQVLFLPYVFFLGWLTIEWVNRRDNRARQQDWKKMVLAEVLSRYGITVSELQAQIVANYGERGKRSAYLALAFGPGSAILSCLLASVLGTLFLYYTDIHQFLVFKLSSMMAVNAIITFTQLFVGCFVAWLSFFLVAPNLKYRNQSIGDKYFPFLVLTGDLFF
jgi:hypothetical protein